MVEEGFLRQEESCPPFDALETTVSSHAENQLVFCECDLRARNRAPFISNGVENKWLSEFIAVPSAEDVETTLPPVQEAQDTFQILS